MNKAGIVVKDQMGFTVSLPHAAKRIVSLVPSQTELLIALGLESETVGLTRFCIHPAHKVVDKIRIGGTKDFDFEKIKGLNPDLIIGNKEENYVEGITELKKHYPVWMSDITTLNDAYEMMQAIGNITDKAAEVKKLVEKIKASFSEISIANYQLSIKTCAYFIWRKPYMVAAQGTFIDNMLGILGVKNAFGNFERYPAITAAQIAAIKPDFIFLSSEPYSFTYRHKKEFEAICPTARIIIVDGELFSWYGSRLQYTAAYFNKLKAEIIER